MAERHMTIGRKVTACRRISWCKGPVVEESLCSTGAERQVLWLGQRGLGLGKVVSAVVQGEARA